MRPLSSSRYPASLTLALLDLEQTWEQVVQEPPSVGEVTQFLVPKLPPPPSNPGSGTTTPRTVNKRRGGQKNQKRTYTLQENEELKRKTEAWQASDKFQKVLAGRMSLPAWKSKEEVLSALDKHRVLVVVGEVSLPSRCLSFGVSSSRPLIRPAQARRRSSRSSSLTMRSRRSEAARPTSS